MTNEVRPPWRPSKYKAEFCESVIEWGRQGKSRTWMAAKLEISRECIYEWERQHPDFSDALKRAKALEQMWWEDAGQDGMTGEKFNTGVWARSMGCRFPDDWREKVAHVGGDRGRDEPIQQEISLTADAFTSRIIGQASRARDDGAAGLDPATDQS